MRTYVNTAELCQCAELIIEREFVWRARTVNDADSPGRIAGQRLVPHRPQRRDPGAAGDEEEVRFVGRLGEHERSERPFEIDLRAGREIRQVGPGGAVGPESDQELERAIAGGFGGSHRDRVRPPRRLSVGANERGLTGEKRKGAVERQPYQQ